MGQRIQQQHQGPLHSLAMHTVALEALTAENAQWAGALSLDLTARWRVELRAPSASSVGSRVGVNKPINLVNQSWHFLNLF